MSDKITPFKNPERVDMVEELREMLALAEKGEIIGYVACFETGSEYEIRSTASPFDAIAMGAMMMHKFNAELLA